MQRIALAVFDISGTVIHDGNIVKDSFKKAFMDYKICFSDTDIDEIIGYEKHHAIKLLFSSHNIYYDTDLLDAIYGRFIYYIKSDFSKYDIYPFPSANSIFRWLNLNNILVALNTGFDKEITYFMLDKFGWNDNPNIQAVICSDEVSAGRPSAQMIFALMKQLGISDPKLVLKIGDTGVDIEEGKSAGCGLVVAVTTGSYTKDQLMLYNPDHIINDLSEIKSILD